MQSGSGADAPCNAGQTDGKRGATLTIRSSVGAYASGPLLAKGLRRCFPPGHAVGPVVLTVVIQAALLAAGVLLVVDQTDDRR